MSKRPRVLAAAIDFGLGPTGKLASVIEANPECEWYACGDKLVAEVFNSFCFRKALWSREPEALARFVQSNDITAAVVVLDPEMAVLLEQLDVQVIYIDSLPFLWTEADLVPHSVTRYCAQNTDYLPIGCWSQLQQIQNLHWLEAIVPTGKPLTRTVRPGKALINVGGVHSTDSNPFSYLEVVIPPVLDGLQKSGYREVTISGSPEPIKYARELCGKNSSLTDLQISFGSFTHRRFLEEVASSSALLTSPGLTTLLESAELGIPTALLPPQNLSQYRNRDLFCRFVENSEAMSWENSQLQLHNIEKLLPLGEHEVVSYIWREIGALVNSDETRQSLQRQTVELCQNLKLNKQSNQLMEYFGMQGALQVRDLLREILKSASHSAGNQYSSDKSLELVANYTV